MQNIAKAFCSKKQYKTSPFQRLLNAVVRFIQAEPFISDDADDKNDVLFVCFVAFVLMGVVFPALSFAEQGLRQIYRRSEEEVPFTHALSPHFHR